MKRAISAVIFAVSLLVVCTLVGCSSTEREYYEDIIVTLEDSSEKIVIKEWSYLQGSGAEIYYQKGNQDPILLGKTTGGDDGFCPFKAGMYDVLEDDDSITVRWAFRGSEKDKSTWRSKTFDIPKAVSE